MSNPQLDSFVSQSRQAGQSDEQIRQALTGAGWGADDVNLALGGGSSISSIPSPINPTMPSISSASSPVPFGVKFLAVLGFIGAVMAMIAGGFSLVGGFIFGSLIKQISTQVPLFQAFGNATTWMFALLGLVLIIFGILDWIASRGLKRGQNWARYFLLFVIGLNIIQTIIIAVASGPISKLYSLIIPLVIGAYLLFSKKVKRAFGTTLLPNDRRRLVIFCIIILLFMGGIWIASAQLGSKIGGDVQNSLNTTATPAPGEQASLTDQAWMVFESALTALKNHDLAGFQKATYPVPGHSPDYNECLKNATKAECDDQMNSFFDLMAGVLGTVKRSDMTHEVHDSKQIILYSEPIATTTQQGMTYQKSSLYFIIETDGAIKFLSGGALVGGVDNPQFLIDTDQDGISDREEGCTGSYAYDKSCVKTDPNNRDTNGNGWWDGIDQALGNK